MNCNQYLESSIGDETREKARLFNTRIDHSLSFINSLLQLASAPIPLLERNNYLWISIANLMEVMGRNMNTCSDVEFKGLFKTLLLMMTRINAISEKLPYDNLGKLKYWTLDVDYHPGLDPVRSNIMTKRTDTWNRGYSFINYTSAKTKGRTYDGLHAIPITFYADQSVGYNRNDLGVWCMEDIEKSVALMDMTKLRVVILWVNSKMSDSQKDTIRDIILEQGYYAVFSDINILNAHNLYSSEQYDQVPGMKFSKREIEYTQFDYLNQSDFARYIRVPYQDYLEVDDLYDQAAHSKIVDSIYVCLYRITPQSRLINNLITASINNIHVYAYIELNASGNERTNLDSIHRLMHEGNPKYMTLQFSYIGMKVHAKIGLVVKKDGTAIVHLATGNFNQRTADCYTDIHKISDHQDEISQAITTFQELITETPRRYGIQKKILGEIQKETVKGPAGKIAIKCNHMMDPDILDALTKAAKFGVSIHCIVRTTDDGNATDFGTDPHRVIGRYLEHERIYAFGQGDDLRVYAGSADLLFRNLYSRMEVLFRVDLDNPDFAWRLASEIWQFADNHD